MKKVPLFIFFSTIMVIAVSCGESSKEREQREQIDSLENANAQKAMDYEDLQKYLSIIADGLDSISIEEKELFVSPGPTSTEKYNKQGMKQQLDKVREILSRHRERITQLEHQLSNSTGDAKKLHTIITALKQQLAEKDKELEQLRMELDDSRKSIEDLQQKVSSMQSIHDDQQNTIEEQQATIDKLNKAYIKIATKKELKRDGLLSGGFLKKTKIDYSSIDLSLFETIDMHLTTTISVPDKIKILTPVPEGSYRISNNTITILNPDLFWSLSNFLIIQTD